MAAIEQLVKSAKLTAQQAKIDQTKTLNDVEGEAEVEAEAPSRVDLDDKYKELIKRINKQTNFDEGHQGGDSEEGLDMPVNDGNSENLNTANGMNIDNKLKKLYDSSVGFKNDLANLRGSIKNLNSKTQAYSGKCTDLQNELDSLFEMNKQV